VHQSDFEDELVETPGRDDLDGASQRQLNRVGFLEVCWLTLPTATRTLQPGGVDRLLWLLLIKPGGTCKESLHHLLAAVHSGPPFSSQVAVELN